MVSYVGRFAPAVAVSLASQWSSEPATELTSSRSNTTNGDATCYLLASLAALAQSASGGTGCKSAAYGSLSQCIVGSASAAGDYAATVATGTATRPKEIWVVVRTSTQQRVSVAWNMVCTRGYGAGSKSGQLSLQTWANVTPTGGKAPGSLSKLRMPTVHPDSCTVGASAQLSRSGRLTVQILALR